MDRRQLRYFMAVAETRRFGRASERLQVSESTISPAIRALEDELGATLLERTTRMVSVTTAGTFLPDGPPLADKPDSALSGLRDESWVAYDGDHPPLNEAATHACLQAGFARGGSTSA
jgi:hypothetical protein